MTYKGDKMEEKVKDNEQQVVMFTLHDEDFSIDISQIAEILKIPTYTKIPCSAPYVEGIINFRGVITAVIDLNLKLGFAKNQDTSESRIIVIEMGEQEAIGLRVDSVSEVIKIKTEDIKSAPIVISEKISSNYIRGVVVMSEQKLLIVLDANKILSGAEVKNLAQVAKAMPKAAAPQKPSTSATTALVNTEKKEEECPQKAELPKQEIATEEKKTEMPSTKAPDNLPKVNINPPSA
jgi:purine-binding chemotaxis protein CheW